MDSPRDIYHQVKNHLAVYQSLLRLKRSTLEEPGQRRLTEDLEARFSILTYVYQRVFREDSQAEGSGSLEAQGFLEEICGGFGLPPWELSLETDLQLEEPLRLHAQSAVPLGLLITELLLNIRRHAFPDYSAPAAAGLSFKGSGEGWILEIWDKGAGCDSGASDSGIGFSLVEALAQQLGGESRRKDGEGTRWIISLPSSLFT